MNSRKRNGRGEDIYLYYDLCEKVWGRSPATQQMETGLESVDLTASMPNPNNTSLDNREVEENLDEESEQSNDHQPSDQLPDDSESCDQPISSNASLALDEQGHRRQILSGPARVAYVRYTRPMHHRTLHIKTVIIRKYR